MTVNLNGIIYNVLSNGAVMNEHGIKINIADGFKFIHSLISRNVTLVTDSHDNVYKVFPSGKVTNLEETKVITDEGFEYFLDFLFLEQDKSLFNHTHESHVVFEEVAEDNEDEVDDTIEEDTSPETENALIEL